MRYKRKKETHALQMRATGKAEKSMNQLVNANDAAATSTSKTATNVVVEILPEGSSEESQPSPESTEDEDN